jgi:hypothetical protein
MKKILRKLFRIKTKASAKMSRSNKFLSVDVMHQVHSWEFCSGDVIRCQFNRNLYHRYLETIKRV